MRKAIVLKIGLLFVISTISCKAPQPNLKKPQTITEKTDQLLADLQDLCKNSGRNKENREIIKKFSAVIINETREDPEAIEGLVTDIINQAAKSGPGMALLVEDFASTAAREEMAQLRKENGIIQIQEKNNQILALRGENEGLKKDTANFQEIQRNRDELVVQIAQLQNQLATLQNMGTQLGQKTAELQGVQKTRDELSAQIVQLEGQFSILKQENGQLKQKTTELQEIQRNRDELSAQITRLQDQLNRGRKFEQEKDNQIAELKKKLPTNTKEGVPVLLDSPYTFTFRITNRSDGRTWDVSLTNENYSLGGGYNTEIKLPPGAYTVIIVGHDEEGSKEVIVSETPSYSWKGYWYHGHFTTGK